MHKYIVKIENLDIREKLKEVCYHVGLPKILYQFIIIETDENMDSIQNIDGIIDIEEDKRDEPQKVQEGPENWMLSQICGQNNKYLFKRTGKNVDIYIMDSGIRSNHKDFNDRVETIFSFDGKDYNDSSHGTACASIAAGKYYGIAKEACIKNVRYDWSTSEGIKAFDSILYHHLEKRNRTSVLNMGFKTRSKFYYEILKDLYDAGIVLVSSSGNTGNNIDNYPASFDFVISVSANDENYKLTNFTNYGATCDIFAPGVSIKSADIDSRESTNNFTGTSFSCSCVIGVICLICENAVIERSDGVDKVKQILLKHAWKDKLIFNHEKYKDTPNLLVNSNVKNSRLDYRRQIKASSEIYGDEDAQIEEFVQYVKRGFSTTFVIKTNKFHYVTKVVGPEGTWDGKTFYTNKLYEDAHYVFETYEKDLTFTEKMQYKLYKIKRKIATRLFSPKKEREECNKI